MLRLPDADFDVGQQTTIKGEGVAHFVRRRKGRFYLSADVENFAINLLLASIIFSEFIILGLNIKS
jgi:hypothetical protein